MKKIYKYMLLVISTLALCVSVYCMPMFIIFLEGGYSLEKEDFYKNQNDFYTVVNFLKDFAEENSQEEYICLLVNGGTVDTMTLSWTRDGEYLEMDEKTRESLVVIVQIFNGKHSLDAIRIRNNNISFDIKDGQYSLVYSVDNKPPAKIDAEKNQKFNVNKIEDHWYHKVPKRKWN